MKKIIFAAAALFAFGFANAQDAKEESAGGGFANGDVFISGSVGINSSKTGDFKTNDFNITPRVGFFVADNIAIGASLGYMSTKLDDGSDDVSNSAFSVGVFGRYYATPASDFSFFAELGFDYLSYDSEFAVIDGEIFVGDSKPSEMRIGLRPGVSYFMSSNWALEASIGALEYSSYDPDGGDKTTGFGLNVDLTNVNVGLIYKF